MKYKGNGRFVKGGAPKILSSLRLKRLDTIKTLKHLRFLYSIAIWRQGKKLLEKIHREISPQMHEKWKAEARMNFLTKSGGDSVVISRLIISEEFEPSEQED